MLIFAFIIEKYNKRNVNYLTNALKINVSIKYFILSTNRTNNSFRTFLTSVIFMGSFVDEK